MSAFTFEKTPSLITALEEAITRHGGNFDHVIWLTKGNNFATVMRLADAQPTPPPEPAAPVLPTEKPADLIEPDRTLSLQYPNKSRPAIAKKLQTPGPANYRLEGGVIAWLHDGQKGRYISGSKILADLESSQMISRCLDVFDAIALQKLPIGIFRRFFKGLTLYFWKSTVTVAGKNLVPTLREMGEELIIHWVSVDQAMGNNRPGLMFP